VDGHAKHDHDGVRATLSSKEAPVRETMEEEAEFLKGPNSSF
jgi:hypothetical protein